MCVLCFCDNSNLSSVKVCLSYLSLQTINTALITDLNLNYSFSPAASCRKWHANTASCQSLSSFCDFARDFRKAAKKSRKKRERDRCVPATTMRIWQHESDERDAIWWAVWALSIRSDQATPTRTPPEEEHTSLAVAMALIMREVIRKINKGIVLSACFTTTMTRGYLWMSSRCEMPLEIEKDSNCLCDEHGWYTTTVA